MAAPAESGAHNPKEVEIMAQQLEAILLPADGKRTGAIGG
jgi:hypothetical protein